MFSRSKAYLLVGVALWAASSAAFSGGLVVPPTVRYIGPEVSCDHPTIEAAIEDLFGPFNAPLGQVQLRLSPNYVQQEKLSLSRSLAIIGGYDECQGPSNGEQHMLTNPTGPGALFTIEGSSSRRVEVNLVSLSLQGNGSISPLGGLIELRSYATLRLDNVRVAGGSAVRGGGVAMLGGRNRLEIERSVITGNRAVEDGGGIWCQDFGVVDLRSGSVSSNSADRHGGGIALDTCDLDGDQRNVSRRIEFNEVLRETALDAPGKGGGIYATGAAASVELGGLLSDTVIRGNRVAKWLEEADANNRAVANGGGLHLTNSARATLRNVRFIENEAPNGGAIAMDDGAGLNMDRTSGPCLRTRASECSALIGNIATGQQRAPSDPIYVGAGSTLVGLSDDLRIVIRRTEIRENFADDHDGLPFGAIAFTGSMIRTFGSETEVTLEQNLIFSNLINGDTESAYFKISGAKFDLLHNTIVFNERADEMIRVLAPINAIGNIWLNPELDDLHEEVGFRDFVCNLHDQSVTAVRDSANATDDPLFREVPVGDFTLLPASPAINRCGGHADLPDVSFDIHGRLRPSADGASPLLGTFDAGAIEFQSDPANEVDLELNLSDANFTTEQFAVTLTNVGLTAATNYSVRLTYEGSLDEVAATWTCSGDSSDVLCRPSTDFDLQPGQATPPLELTFGPDIDGSCSFSARAQSSQPDTVPVNDTLGIGGVVDCNNTIFTSNFE